MVLSEAGSMTDHYPTPAPQTAEQAQRLARRNRALGLGLGGLVLFIAVITYVRLSGMAA